MAVVVNLFPFVFELTFNSPEFQTVTNCYDNFLENKYVSK